MPRQAKPWYRSQTDSWYVITSGQQRILGKHPEDAPAPKRGKNGWNAPPAILTAFHKHMAEGPALPKADAILVCQVCDLFLTFSERQNDPRTFRWYRSYLQNFCEQYGRLKSSELKPIHVNRWLDSHPNWGTGRRCAITAVKRAFNYAVDECLLPASPIKTVKKSAVPSRGRVMSRDDRAEILAAIRDEHFRLFVEALQESGCRPSEVARVTADDVNLEVGVWVLHKHKTSKKTGKPRIVYLTPRLIEITKLLMAKHPTGTLFRGPRFGKPFAMQGICSRFRRLRAKLPHLKNAISYAYRASFTTDALTNGVGIAQVAELLGHNSTTMVMKHYSFIRENTEHMKAAALKATA